MAATQVLIVNVINPQPTCDDQSLWDDMYLDFRKGITEKYTTRIVTDVSSVISALTNQTELPRVALVVCAELFQPGHEKNYAGLHKQLASFAKDAGGTVIFCAMIPNLGRWDQIPKIFNEHYGLPWKMAAYTKVEQVPNELIKPTIGEAAFATLEEHYPKAVFLSGVDKGCMMYVPKKYEYNDDEEDSSDEEGGAAGDDDDEYGQKKEEDADCMTAFQSYGNGHIGWIGDVNNHEGPAVNAIHAMIGVAIRSDGFNPSAANRTST